MSLSEFGRGLAAARKLAEYHCSVCSQVFMARVVKPTSYPDRYCSEGCKQKAKYRRVKARRAIETKA